MKNKIKISKISKKCYSHKGFNHQGCYGCDCTDSCCRYGADFDKESYDLVIKNKALIEPLINAKIEKWFEKKFSNDKDFLGGNSIRSKKGETGFCVFHSKKGKGCVLYELATTKNINKRIIPSICRIFPLSWENGRLVVYDEQEDEKIPCECNCKELKNNTSKSLLETQKKEIEDIFDIDEKRSKNKKSLNKL